MKIKSAEYIISAAAKKQFPNTTHPEIAFAGKSNVGKSTLINSLMNRKNLVKTSATPGKTRLINFFLNLPGYGFAKVAYSIKVEWQELMETYLSERASLKGVILIIDSRHGASPLDLQLREWLKYYDIPVLIIANKIDKIKKNQRQKNLKLIQTQMDLLTFPIAHSSLKKIGQTEIWQALTSWLS